MQPDVRERMDRLEEIARLEPQYHILMQEMRDIEKLYNLVLRDLDDQQRDAVCEFVSQCEEISWYMLELACYYMRFPDKTTPTE